MVRPLIICLSLLLLKLPMQAQNFQIRQLTTRDGLPSDVVYDFAQGPEGEIWIGTENGVCRFNGKDFHYYSVEDGLPGNIITQLAFDSLGRLWVNHLADQISCIFPNDSILIPTLPPSFSRDIILQKVNEEVLFVSKNSPSILFGRRPELQHSLAGWEHHPGSLLFYNGRYYQLRSTDTLFRLDRKVREKVSLDKASGRVARFTSCIQKDSLVICTAQDRELPYWLINLNQLNIRPLSLPPLQKISPDDVNRMYLDTRNQLWICRRDGLTLLEQPLAQNSPHHHLLKGVFVNSILQDTEGSYWIGTEGDGIFQLSPSPLQTIYPYDDRQTAIIRAAAIASSGDLLLASSTGQLTRISKNLEVTAREWITEKRIVDLLVSDGNLWIATDNSVLKTGFGGTPPVEYPVDGPVKTLLQRPGGQPYALSRVVQKVQIPEEDPLCRQGSRTYSGLFVSQDFLYLGATDGLLRYDFNRHSLHRIRSESLKSDVRAIVKGPDQILWVATKGQGVFGLRGDSLAHHIDRGSGLPSNICNDLLVLGDTLWVATNRGLARHLLSTSGTDLFGPAEGLNDLDIHRLLRWKQKLVAVSGKCLYVFPPSLSRKEEKPRIRFSGITVNGETLELKEKLNLPASTRSLRISYTGVALRSRGRITYAYRMKGMEERWLETTSSTANFPGLRPGSYQFELRARTPGGSWTDPIGLSITIAYPWWQQGWFLISASIFFLLLGLLIFRLVWRWQKQRNETRQKLLKYQLTALRARMNPHFMFNAFNSIQEFINKSDPLSANYYLSRFASLIRRILQQATEETITLKEEVEQLELYLKLEQMRLGNSFKYDIKREADLDTSWIRIPNMIIQPFVENAVIHGLFHKEGEKRLSIHFSSPSPGELRCVITDNGIGRREAARLKNRQSEQKSQKSIGISTTRQRLQLLKDSKHPGVGIQVEDLFHSHTGDPSGTRVLLNIPI